MSRCIAKSSSLKSFAIPSGTCTDSVEASANRRAAACSAVKGADWNGGGMASELHLMTSSCSLVHPSAIATDSCDSHSKVARLMTATRRIYNRKSVYCVHASIFSVDELTISSRRSPGMLVLLRIAPSIPFHPLATSGAFSRTPSNG